MQIRLAKELNFAGDCGYITVQQHAQLTSCCEEIGRMLGSMLKNPEPFLISDLRPPTSAA